MSTSDPIRNVRRAEHTCQPWRSLLRPYQYP